MEAKGIRLQGELGISRQTIAQGMPACLGCTCMLVCASLLRIAHETAGAASTRHSLLPPILKEGTSSCKPRADHAARTRNYIRVIASAAKQSILSLCREVDCFASLAMTWMGRGALDTPHVWDIACSSGGTKSSGRRRSGFRQCQSRPCERPFLWYKLTMTD